MTRFMFPQYLGELAKDLKDWEEAEVRLREAVASRKAADLEYTAALKNAKAHGMSNVKAAAIAGITETAVRMWLRRH